MTRFLFRIGGMLRDAYRHLTLRDEVRIAVTCIVILAGWIIFASEASASPHSTEFIRSLLKTAAQDGLVMLLVLLLIMSLSILAIEIRGFMHRMTIDKERLDVVEYTHPYVPRTLQIAIAVLLALSLPFFLIWGAVARAAAMGIGKSIGMIGGALQISSVEPTFVRRLRHHIKSHDNIRLLLMVGFIIGGWLLFTFQMGGLGNPKEIIRHIIAFLVAYGYIGLLIILIVTAISILTMEIRGIVNIFKVEEERLDLVEFDHPYLPDWHQIILTIVLAVTLPFLLWGATAQAASIVQALKATPTYTYTENRSWQIANDAGGTVDNWTGGGADNKWSTSGNWSGGVPTKSNIAYFGSTNTKNATVDTSFNGNISELKVAPGYTGTISLGRNLNVNGQIILSGGTIVSNGNTIRGSGSWLNYGSNHFTAGTGTVILTGTGTTQTLSGSTFNNLTINDGLVGYWKMDDGSGSTVLRDSSGNGHNGSLSNGPTWSTNVPGKSQFYNPKSLHFDGTNDFVTLTNAYTPAFSNLTYTISMWIYPQSLANNPVIFDTTGNPNASTSDTYIELTSTGKIDWSSQNSARAYASGLVGTGSWYHLAFVKTGTGNQGVLYVNGVQQNTFGGHLNNANTVGTNITLGKYNAIAGEEYRGLIDDVRLYNRAMSGSEVRALYNGNQNTGSGMYTLGSALTVNGNLNIVSGGIDASTSNFAITVGGNWSNAGTLTPRSGTVTFNGTNQTMTGTTVFWNFTKSVSSAAKLFFDFTGRQSFSGALTLNGAAGNLLSIRSTQSGSGAHILLDGDSGTQTLSYLDVKDSDATGGAQLSCGNNCTDNGNNTNWSFAVPTVTWTGAGSDNNWSTAANWSGNAVPSSTDNIVFDSTGKKNAVVDSSFAGTVNSITIAKSYTGSITLSHALTVNGNLTDSGTNVTGLTWTAGTQNNLHIVGNMTVNSGATVTVAYSSLTGNGSGQSITVDGNLTVATGATITANGQGFSSGNGPAGGGSNARSGTYGGDGLFNPNATYGSISNPTALGSAGRDSSGGGSIQINCGGSMTVNGTVSANGANGTYYIGAGGSVNITANSLGGAGTISATGGNSNNNVYSGGGGRISLANVTTNSFHGTLSVNGGTVGQHGYAGTIYFDATHRNALTIGGAGNLQTLRLGSDDADNYTFNTITVASGGVLEVEGNPNKNSGNGGAATLNVGTLTVQTGGLLRANGLGFHSGGPGSVSTNAGGTYGGQGALNSTVTYGSITNPLYLGSNGNDRGGGAIIINAGTGVVIYGTVSADGDSTSGDGGAGGTVNVRTPTISGNGTMSANGGGIYYGGGGGRIAVVLTSGTSFGNMTMQAYGGNAQSKGAAGTVYKKAANQTYGDVIVDNNSLSALPLRTVIMSGATVGSLKVQNSGVVLINTGVTLNVLGTGTVLNVKSTATLTNSGTLVLGGTGSSIAGTFTNATTSTVNYVGQNNHATARIANVTYGKLGINGASTTFQLPSTGSTLNVFGNLTLTGGTLAATNGMTITLSGSWIHNGGSFNAGTGTVMMIGAGSTSINETSTFNNLTFGAGRGLVGYWKLDDGTGSSTATDSSGNGNTGTLTNSPTWSTVVPGVRFADSKSLNFNGSNQFVKMGNSSAINGISNSKTTVSAWIKTSSAASPQLIFSTWDGTNGYQLFLFTGKAALWSNQGGNLASNVTVNDNAWHHLVAEWDGTQRKVYVDGAFAISGNGTFAATTRDNQIGTQCTGANSTTCNGYFNGYLDDVRVYNRTLTAAEISALANGNQLMGSGTYALGAALTASGGLDIENGNLDASASNYNITVGGNYSNYGTLTTHSNTVTLKGTGNNYTMSGSLGFNNLTLNDGLVGYWKLDDGTGSSIARDSSGNGNNGTLTNGPTWGTSVPTTRFYDPKSLHFDGVNDYVTTNSRAINGASPFTIGGWIKFERQSTDYEIPLWNGIDSATAGFGFIRKPNSSIIRAGWGSSNGEVAGPSTTNGVWYHVASTYNGTSQTFYVNGTSQGTVSYSASNFTSGVTTFGNLTSSSIYWFRGNIDDVRVYNRALSASEVATLANGYQNTGSGNYVLGAALTVNGNLNIVSGNLDASASNYGITAKGNWMNVGNFTPHSDTVTLSSTANQTMSGNTIFWNLTKLATSTGSLFFDPTGRQSASGSLNLMGVQGGLLKIRSTHTGTGAHILLDGDSGTQNLKYIDVKDSNASGGATLTCASDTDGCVDSGNNTNWNITRSTVTWTGNGSDNNWSTAANWSTNVVPTSFDNVIFDSTGKKNAVINSSFAGSVHNLTISKSYTGSITLSHALTVNGDLTDSGSSTTGITWTAGSQNNLHIVGNMTVNSGATVTVAYSSLTGNGSGQNIIVDGNLTVATGATIDANEQGFPRQQGPGAQSGVGGSHGGVGDVSSKATYGSISNPTELGSGGNYNPGGGAIILNVGGTLTVNGTLSANGDLHTSVDDGAGGSINITAATLTGKGYIQADGGNGFAAASGGGGRISLANVTTNTFTGTIQAKGGSRSLSVGLYAYPGTIYLDAASRNNLVLGGTGHMQSLTLGSDGTNDYTFGTLTINSGGTLIVGGNPQMNSNKGGAATLNITTLSVQSNGSLNADCEGFGHGIAGPAAGYSNNGVGGTYGGMGSNNTNATYGSIQNPINLGSAGYYSRTCGGGAIILKVSGSATIAGTVSANGQANAVVAGGAGGSVNITAATIAGTGTLKASSIGGSNGAGAGGRIAVILTSGTSFGSLNFQAYGSTGASPGNGAAGTVYKKAANQTYGDVIVDNNNISAAPQRTVIMSGATVGSVTVQNSGVVLINTGVTLNVLGTGTVLNVKSGTTLSNSGTLVLGGTGSSIAGTFTNATTSTVNYVGQNNHATATIANATYGKLGINGASTTFQLPSSASTINVFGSLTLTGGTLAVTNANTITLSGSWLNAGGTFSAGTGTVVMSGVGATTVKESGAFNNLAIDNGLLGYWKFDDGAGTTVRDSGRNGYTGTITGTGGTWTSSVPSGIGFTDSSALQLDGTNYIDTTGTTGLNPSNFTVSLWMKPAAASQMYMAGKEDGNATSGWRMLMNANQTITLMDRGNTNSLTTSSTVPLNTWTQVTGVWSQSGLRIYIGGTSAASKATAYGAVSNTKSITIGSIQAFKPYFNGSLDDVRIYSRALAASEIAHLAAGNATTGSGNVTLGAALTVNGNLSIDDSTLDASASNYGITVGGNYSNYGTLTTHSNTVTLKGTGNNYTMSGSLGFNNLTLNDGLVGYWKLDDGTGSSIARDSSGNGNNGTLTNGPTWSTNVPSKMRFYNPTSLHFDGVDDYVNLGNPSILSPANAITVSAWFKTVSNAGMLIVRNRFYGYGLSLDTAGKLNGSEWVSSSTSVGAVSASSYTDGVWHMGTFTYDGVNTKLYADGNLVNSTGGGTGIIYYQGNAVAIGRDADASDSYFSGNLDDVRIYNRALSASEIAHLASGYANTGSGNYVLGAALTVNGNLNIVSGNLDASASNYGITANGNWMNAGNFTPHSDTVTLSSTANQTMSGNTVFWNLTKLATNAASLFFDPTGRQSASGSLSLMGVQGGLLSIRSTHTATGAHILLDGDAGSQNLRWLDVKDSDATGGATLTCHTGDGGCTDSGNNTNWSFSRTYNITGTVYSNTGGTTPLTGVKVAVSLNGAAVSGTGTVDSGGQFTIGSIPNTSLTGGTVVALYISGSSNKAVTVSTGSGGSMTGMTLIKNQLIVRSGTGTHVSIGSPVTSAMLTIAKNTGYSDITSLYSVSSNNLTVATGKTLNVWTGSLLSLGGTLTASNFHENGNVIQGNNALTINSAFTMSGGTFTGSSGGTAITINGTFSQSSGTFTSTSGTMAVTSNFTRRAGTFTHNSGTVTFSDTNVSPMITTGGATFYNLTLTSADNTTPSSPTTLADSFTVANTLSVTKTAGGFGTAHTWSASSPITITLQGNFSMSQSVTGGGLVFGNANVTVNMTGADSSFTSSTVSNGAFNANLNANGTGTLSISKADAASSSGTTTLNQNAKLTGNSMFYNLTIASGKTLDASPDGGTTSNNLTINNTFTNSGTFTARTGTVTLSDTFASPTITTGGATFYNLTLTSAEANGGTPITTFADNFTVANTLSVTKTAGGFGTTHIWSAASPITITLQGNFSMSQSTAGGGLVFGNTNVTVNMTGADTSFTSSTISNGAFNANLNANGTGTLSISKADASSSTGTTTLNQNAKLTGNSMFYNLTIASGKTLDASPDGGTTSYNLTITNTFTNSGTFTARNGTVTFSDTNVSPTITTGNATFYNLTLTSGENGGISNTTFADSFTVTNNLNVTKTNGSFGTGHGWIASSPIIVALQGNYSMSQVAVGGGLTFGNSNVTLKMTGSNAQTIAAPTGTFSPNVVVAKSANALTLSGALTMNTTGQNLFLTGGTLNLNGNNLTVNKTIVIGTGTTLRLHGTETLSYTTFLSQSHSTIWYDSAGSSAVKMQQIPYQNVIIGSTGSTIFTPSTGQMNMSGSLTLSGGTLNVNGGQTLLLSGSWLHTGGTFNSGTGTVIMRNVGASTLTESNAFNNLQINDGLVGYWKLDDGTGSSIARDSSGNRNNGTLTNGPTWSTSVPSTRFYDPKSVHFDGVDDDVKVNSLPLAGLQKLTLSYWYQVPADPGTGPVLMELSSNSNTNVNGSFYTNTYSTGLGASSTRFATALYGTGPSYSLADYPAPSLGWHHFTMVYDRTKATHQVEAVYVDGVSQSLNYRLQSLGANTTFGTFDFYMGRRADGSNGAAQGSLDDVRMYSRKLSASEIAHLASGYLNSGSGVVTLGANLDVNGNLNIADSTLDPTSSNKQINLAGNLLDAGSITQRSNSFILDGTNQTISGSTLFYNFTKAVSSAAKLFFDYTSRQSFSGALTMNGAASNLLSIRSTQSGSGAHILLDGDAGTQTLSYLDVKDSDATGGATLICHKNSDHCVDSGNNTNWNFVNRASATGSILGYVWNDLNGNGIRTGDESTGLNNITVTLSGNTFTGALLTVTTTTNSLGQYSFSGTIISDASGYTVNVNTGTLPSGYLRTRFNSSGSNVLGTGAVIRINFGYVPVSTLTGSVFVDSDSNGLKAVSETQVFSGTVVELSGTTDTGGTISLTTKTNASGTYVFNNLPTTSGSFVVAAEAPAGYTTTTTSSRLIAFGTGGQIKNMFFGYKLIPVASSSSAASASSEGFLGGGTRGENGYTVTIVPAPQPIAQTSSETAASSTASQTTSAQTSSESSLTPAQTQQQQQELANEIAVQIATGLDYAVKPVAPVVQTIGQIQSTVTQSIQSTVDATKNAAQSLTQSVNALQDAAKQTVASATATLSNAVTNLGQTVASALQSVSQSTQTAITNAADTMQSALASAAQGIAQGTQTAMQTVQDAGALALQNIEKLGTVGQTTAQIARVTGNAIGTAATSVKDMGVLTIAATQTAFGTVQEAANSIAGTVVGTATQTTIQIAQSVTNAQQSIQSAIDTTTTGVTEIAQQLTDATAILGQNANELAMQATDAATQVGQTIADTLSTTQQTMSDATQQGIQWSATQIAGGIGAVQNGIGTVARSGRDSASYLALRLRGLPNHAAAPSTLPPPQKYTTQIRKDSNGQTLIASLSMSVFDSFGQPYANTPVVLFSTPKIAVTNSGGVATFHDVETGKHQLEIHVSGGTVEKRDFILEPPSVLPLDTQKELDVVLPVIQVMVAEPVHGAAPAGGIPVYAWIIIALLAGGNIGWFTTIILKKRAKIKELTGQ